MASAAALSNPIAMTCAAVEAMYYGWSALSARPLSRTEVNSATTDSAYRDRLYAQWQYRIATGSPLTVNSTAPQKQLPLQDGSVFMVPLLHPSMWRTDAAGVRRTCS